MLLGIVPSKKPENRPLKLKKSTDGGSLPDAWIYGEDFAVLVESKIVGALGEDQMAKHYEKLASSAGRKPRHSVYTWNDIHRFFLRVSSETESRLTAKDKWIIGQFTQYMEWIGMADYIGIKPEMFDHFAARPDVRSDDTRQWIRGSMEAFGEKVRDKLQEIGLDFYEDFLVGKLKITADHCWVALGHTKLKKYAHQTFSLYADGLEVFVNVEMKALTDKLNKKIHHDRQAFRETIANLPMPFYIQVQEKEHKQAMIYRSHKIARLDAGRRENPKKGSYGLADTILGPRGFDYLEMLLGKIHLA